MHEQRAMRITFKYPNLKINGVAFDELFDVKDRVNAFTEEDREQKYFTSFFKRYCINNKE